MIHIYTKFEDDIFVRSSVILKMLFYHSLRNIEKRLWGRCVTSSMTSSQWKYFFLHNFSFLLSNWSCVLYLAFSKMTAILRSHRIFFIWSDTGNWICYKDSHEHLWHFELLIDALAQILTALLELKVLTYFGTLWRHQWSNPRSFVKAYLQFNDTYGHLVWRWYLCSFFSYHEKCYFFHSWRNIEKWLWGRCVTSSMTSSPWKYFFLHNLGRSFHFWCQIEAVFNILTFSKWPPFWARDEFFYRKWHRKLNMPQR